MAKKKAAVAKTAQADPALARLPTDVVSALKAALHSGRYMLAVVRLDTSAKRLDLFRHNKDIPQSDHEIILNMLRDSLKDA